MAKTTKATKATKATEKPKRKRGRPRHGSEAKELVPIRISADVKRYLDDQDNRSACVEQVIRRTKAFKEWKGNGEQ